MRIVTSAFITIVVHLHDGILVGNKKEQMDLFSSSMFMNLEVSQCIVCLREHMGEAEQRRVWRLQMRLEEGEMVEGEVRE